MLERATESRIDRRRAAVREEILEAAWALARDEGLASLSLRELAARVGMRAPSLYSYFPSKEGIYDAMFAQAQLALAESMARIRPGSGNTVADLERVSHMFLSFCVEDLVRYQLMFQRTIPGFTPSPESYALAVQNLDRLRAGLAALGVTEDGHVDLWTALITGLADQQISNDPGGDRWTRLVGDVVQMYARHVGIPLSPPAEATSHNRSSSRAASRGATPAVDTAKRTKGTS